MKCMETEKLDRILDYVGVFLINILLVLLFVGVILRYIFGYYMPYTGELPVKLLPILIFFLVGLLWKKRSLITLDAVYVHFGRKTKHVFDIIFGVGAVVLAGIWAYGAVSLVFFDIKFSQLTDEMFVNFAYFHAPFALAIVIFAFYIVNDLVRLISHGPIKEPVEANLLPPD
ncbi:TRAP transporter small permease [Chloroflexota bacterium]